MPLFNDMYFDQKWSLWDGWLASVARNVQGQLMTASRRAGNLISAQNRRTNAVTAQNRGTKVITTGG